MNTETQTKVIHELEHLIDTHGLSNIISCIADVCQEKGQHIRENWQDAISARTWERHGLKLQKVAETIRG